MTVSAPTAGRKAPPVPIPTTPRWRSIRIHPVLYAALGLALILLPVQLAQIAGVWTTSGKVGGDGKAITVTGADPAEIKGWMTVQQVLDGYAVPKDDFYAKFGVPADAPPATPLKELEKLVPGFSVDTVRAWLAERIGSGGGSGP